MTDPLPSVFTDDSEELEQLMDELTSVIEDHEAVLDWVSAPHHREVRGERSADEESRGRVEWVLAEDVHDDTVGRPEFVDIDSVIAETRHFTLYYTVRTERHKTGLYSSHTEVNVSEEGDAVLDGTDWSVPAPPYWELPKARERERTYEENLNSSEPY